MRSIVLLVIAAVAVSIFATFAAAVASLYWPDRTAPLSGTVAFAADFAVSSVLAYLPLAAFVGAIVGIALLRGWRWVAVAVGGALAASAGALGGWLLLHNTPAVPLGRGVELMALTWCVLAVSSLSLFVGRRSMA